uniref:Uncharacterized protein n=1 Tax=Oryza rufipogon TaxID=4529 RepID=A0A0E0QC42_ORYRU
MAWHLPPSTLLRIWSGQLPAPTDSEGDPRRRRGEASNSSRRCRLGGGAGEAGAAREKEPSRPFLNATDDPSVLLSCPLEPREECRNKVHRPRDSYNSEALCKLGSYLGGI